MALSFEQFPNLPRENKMKELPDPNTFKGNEYILVSNGPGRDEMYWKKRYWSNTHGQTYLWEFHKLI